MATRVALVMDQGTTFETTIDLTDQLGANLDVTGMNARSQMRRFYSSNNAVSFTTALSNGALVLSLTAGETTNIEAGRYVYDVELIDASNSVTRIIEGIATVTPQVTRG